MKIINIFVHRSKLYNSKKEKDMESKKNENTEKDMWTMGHLQPTCGCSQEEIDKWLTKVNSHKSHKHQ